MSRALLIMHAAREALDGRTEAYLWGASKLVGALGWDFTPVAAIDACLLDWSFARVIQDSANPRRFELAQAKGEGRPAVLVPLTPGGDLATGWWLDDEAVGDVLALDLTPGSAWFRRAEAAVAMMPGRDPGGDVLTLWAGAHRFVGQLARAALAARLETRTGRAPRHPCPPPEGWLVLDPVAVGFKGPALKGVERIALADTDLNGPLAQVLKSLNRRIGARGERGIELVRAA